MDVQLQRQFLLQKLGLTEDDFVKHDAHYYQKLYQDHQIAEMHQKAENEYADECAQKLADQQQRCEHRGMTELEKRYIAGDLRFEPQRGFDEDETRQIIEAYRRVKKVLLQAINLYGTQIGGQKQLDEFKQDLDAKFSKISANANNKEISYPPATKQFDLKRQKPENVDARLEAVKQKNLQKDLVNQQSLSKKADTTVTQLSEFLQSRSTVKSANLQSDWQNNQILQKKREMMLQQDKMWDEQRQQLRNQIGQIQRIRCSSQKRPKTSLEEIDQNMYNSQQRSYLKQIKNLEEQNEKIQHNLKRAKEADYLVQQKQRLDAFKQNQAQAQEKYRQQAEQDIQRMQNQLKEQLKEGVPGEIVERQKYYRRQDYAKRLHASQHAQK